MKGLAALKVADDTPGKGSTLDVFDPSNPFKPPQNILNNSKEDTGTATSDTGATTDTGATDTGTGGRHGRRHGTTSGGTDTRRQHAVRW